MSILYYVHDPMCSWCWGFANTWSSVQKELPEGVEVKRLLGGLAPDSDEPMPDTMRRYLQQTWQRIQQTIPGTEFNFAFWSDNTPRRSTFPACRAVIAAREQSASADVLMTRAIQEAYYLQARNPSDDATLIDLAGDLGLDQQRFASQLNATETQSMLDREMAFGRSIGCDSFPSLLLEVDGRRHPIPVNYQDAHAVTTAIKQAMA